MNRDACNRRWRQLVESGDVTVQLSDGQLPLLDDAWTRIQTRDPDELPAGVPPPGARLVARAVGTTLLWSEIRQGRREFYAWRSVATHREYRPEAPTTSPRAFDRLWR